MPWPDDLIVLAEWALHQEDLRHRFVYAPNATSIATTSGIADAFETTAVLRIYEAVLAKGYINGRTVGYERPYRPGATGNGERADLAFKAEGVGQNWALVEVKYYSPPGVQSDVTKLLRFPGRVQRWMLVYRVVEKRTGGRGAPIQTLPMLMGRYARWADVREAEFDTVMRGKPGRCDIFLGRLIDAA